MSHFQAPFGRVDTALAYLCQTDDFMANLHVCLIKQVTHKCQPMHMEMWSSSKSDKGRHNLGLKQNGKMGKLEGKGQRNHSEQESPYAGLPKWSECKSSPNVAQAPHRCTPSSSAHSLFRNVKANEVAIGTSLWGGHVACMCKSGDISQKQ